jgi:hypothetical protein
MSLHEILTDPRLIGQIIMLATIVLMVTGKTPLYLTAILGSAIAALVAGIPLAGHGIDVVGVGGKIAHGVSLTSMIKGGLNSVLADMAGVLMFIGVMQAVGFLDVIIKTIIKWGRVMGGGPGVAAAGGIAAGLIGALTGFTQPVITGAITGPASVKLGLDPSKAAGVTGHAGHIGNFAGFTHPTQVAVIAATGIHFGWINLVGLVTGLSIFGLSYFRLKREERAKHFKLSKEKIAQIAAEYERNDSGIPAWKAFFPFLILLVGFVIGYPIFLVGIVAGVVTIFMGKTSLPKGEAAMLEGVTKISTPLVATIGFLFMAAVISNVGLVRILAEIFAPIVSVAPIQIMLVASALAGLLTQSNASSAAVSLPVLDIILGVCPDANPLALACAAAGPSAIMQYFLTGGPIAALATVIPVIPGSELKAANRFQRPAMLFGLLVLFVIVTVIGLV